MWCWWGATGVTVDSTGKRVRLDALSQGTMGDGIAHKSNHPHHPYHHPNHNPPHHHPPTRPDGWAPVSGPWTAAGPHRGIHHTFTGPR